MCSTLLFVIQLANAALEELRRAEVRAEPAMKRSRWMWLKDKKKWTKKQIAQHHMLSRMQLKTGRAFRLKEALREIFATASTKAVAKVQMQAWFRCARRSKLAPFKKLALTLKSHWDGILNGFDSALNNGSVEAINGLIQAAKARTRGYRKPRKAVTSNPSNEISPDDASVRRFSISRSVDLPAPERPIIPIIMGFSTVKLAASTAVFPPNFFVTLSNRSIAVPLCWDLVTQPSIHFCVVLIKLL